MGEAKRVRVEPDLRPVGEELPRTRPASLRNPAVFLDSKSRLPSTIQQLRCSFCPGAIVKTLPPFT